MIYTFYFFSDLKDAESFYREVMSKEKYLGLANTAYGLLYFVSVGYPKPKTLRELETLGYDDYIKATEYKSFEFIDSAEKPDDVTGFIKFLKTPNPK